MVRVPCCDKMGVKKGTWTPAEDQILKAYVETHGPGNWRTLPKQAGLARCGKSCRFRWMNYLRSDIKRGDYTEYEEETIIKLHAKFGNRWSLIAAGLPGRTDNEIKNVWHTRLKKRQQRQFPVRPEAHLMNTKAAETDNKPEWLQPPNTSSKPVDVVLPSSLPHVGELLEPQNTEPCDGEEDIMAFWFEILMKLNEFP